MQVVEAFFSKPLPLDGVSVSFALGTAGVSGSFDSGTVVTNAQGIAANNLNLTGFEAGFSGSFEILATAGNVAGFVQQVGSGSLTVETFGSNSTVTSVASSSLDFSQFVGLAELWERRDRTVNCAAIPDFTLAAEDDGEKKDDDELQFDESCFPSSPFETPNRLLDDAVEATLTSDPSTLIGINSDEAQDTPAIIPDETEQPPIVN